MLYQEREPSRALAAVIKHFWELKDEGTSSEPEVILPDGCPELVFNLSDRFERIDGDRTEIQPATLFAGQISRNITIRPTGNISLFAVRFQPAGASVLGRFSLHELTDQTFSIASVLGRDGTELEERLNVAPNFDAKIAEFERFIFRTIRGDAKMGTIVTPSIKLIHKYQGNIAISNLTRSLNTSERDLERNFRERVGLSPKKYARIVRFQSVLRSIESSADSKMLDAALSFGYFDQSHMIRDFREFSGKSPQDYFNEGHRLSALFTAVV